MAVQILPFNALLSVLEANYIIHLLRPHSKNFNKRIIKTPKLYFYDVGLAARLLGIESKEQLHNHAYRGALFESFVIAELLKKPYNAGQPSNIYFWRDRTGNEIDVLMDCGHRLLPVEIKPGRTVIDAYFKGLRQCAIFRIRPKRERKQHRIQGLDSIYSMKRLN